jgi:hypothetical protein
MTAQSLPIEHLILLHRPANLLDNLLTITDLSSLCAFTEFKLSCLTAKFLQQKIKVYNLRYLIFTTISIKDLA